MALVVLTDTRIVQMINDERFRAAIPCIKSANKITHQMVKQSKANCSTCGGAKKKRKRMAAATTAAQAQQDAYEVLASVKQCIKGLPWAKKNQLKTLLNATKIRVHVPVSDRKIVKITF